MNTMTHDGFVATLVVDAEAEFLRGYVLNALTNLDFQGTSIAEARNAFIAKIEQYRDWCKETSQSSEPLAYNQFRDADHEKDPISVEISKRFKLNPTIDNYLNLRREFPNSIITTALNSSIDWLFANDETLKNIGVEPSIVAGVLDADEEKISELCLTLLERLVERKNSKIKGETHLVSRNLAISDSLVNFLISMMLDAIEWNESYILNRDLFVLIREMIGGGPESIWEKNQEVHKNKLDAEFLAAQLIAQDITPSYRMIARIMGVNPTTVMRWFPDNDLFEKASNMSGLIAHMRDYIAKKRLADQNPV